MNTSTFPILNKPGPQLKLQTKFITTISLITVFLFIFGMEAIGGGVSMYKDKNGVVVITDGAVPREYRDRAESIGSTKDTSSPTSYSGESYSEPMQVTPNRSSGQERNRTVDLERRRLQENKKNIRGASSRSKSYQTQKALERQEKTYEKRMEELDKDPEYYFYKKQEREKAVALRPPAPPPSGVTTIIDPYTGKTRTGTVTPGGIILH